MTPVTPPLFFDPGRYLDEIPSGHLIARCIHPGEPIAKVSNGKPRSGARSGRLCAAGTMEQHKQAIAALVAPAVAGKPDSEWAFGVRAVFYVQTHQRKDVDNMLKVVVDALKRLVFDDDCQVKEMMGWSLLDCENPRTEFLVYRIQRIDRESGVCVRCGTAFRKYKSWKSRLYCSQACYFLRSLRGVELSCTHCDRKFVRRPACVRDTTSGQHFCSRACKGKYSRRRENCDICGKAIQRPNSWARAGQVRNFCSRECFQMAPTPARSAIPAERLTEIANKGWETRRRKVSE